MLGFLKVSAGVTNSDRRRAGLRKSLTTRACFMDGELQDYAHRIRLHVYPAALDTLVAYKSPVEEGSISLEVIRLCLTYRSICSRCYKCHKHAPLGSEEGKQNPQDNRFRCCCFASLCRLVLRTGLGPAVNIPPSFPRTEEVALAISGVWREFLTCRTIKTP